MSSGCIFLASGSDLAQASLAGKTGVEYLQDAVASLSSLSLCTTQVDQELLPELTAWLDQGVEQILLVQEDRPLLTSASLEQVVAAQARGTAPWITLASADGELAAGCAAAGWLVEQLRSATRPLYLEGMAPAGESIQVDPAECLAVDSWSALAEAERLLRQRINGAWMEAGVRMIDPATSYVDATVRIGRGSVILPNTHLWGETRIGEACRVGPNSVVRDSQIGNRCVINASVVEEAVMEDEADIGPFGHLRKGARMCRGAHMGNYGEMKNSTLGPNAKMGHFSYLGDATVGAEVNIGAGTITCNYDGAKKHPTHIEEGAFIGSGSMLVAPLRIGAGAKIGAGSVVTHDIPAGAVAYGAPARVKRIEKDKEGQERESGK
jgi:bifunctional N-acetylglucosamine-1-phosphate-uridyltransferase/glucosamine-1-phosphate-acetyltransferase GlmU-like protein